MALALHASIPSLTLDGLSLPPLANRLLSKTEGSEELSGMQVGMGIAQGHSSLAPPTFDDVESYVLKGSISHLSASGAVDYTITLANTDTYPHIFFESYAIKTTAAALTSINMYLGTSSGGTDTGTNYSRQGYTQSNTSAHVVVNNNASAGIIIGTVYSNTSSSSMRQSLIIGRGFLMSGGMRTLLVGGTTCTTSTNGNSQIAYKWTNTSDLVSHVLVSVPANIDLVFNMYQR